MPEITKKFSYNDLIAIQMALEGQIEDCSDFLSDPSVDYLEKSKINEVLKHSRSALGRINLLLESADSD